MACENSVFQALYIDGSTAEQMPRKFETVKPLTSAMPKWQ